LGNRTLFKNIFTAIFEQVHRETLKHKLEFLAHTGHKILPHLKKRPNFICASVARLTEQKFYFFKRSPEALLKILDKLAGSEWGLCPSWDRCPGV
jgi:starch synthase